MAALIAWTASSCQTARMQIAPSLSDVAALEVEGANPRRWNSPIRFGRWATTEATEGMTWSFGDRLMQVDAGYTSQPYRFVLAGESGYTQAQCRTRALELSRDGWTVDPSLGRLPLLHCAFSGPDEGILRLRNTVRGEEGLAEFGADRWTIRSVRRLEGSRIQSADPVGYEIDADGRVIAAVETINRGRVWISPDLAEEDRRRVAALSTALLMYDDPRTD